MKLARWVCCAVSFWIACAGATSASAAPATDDLRHITEADVAFEQLTLTSPPTGPETVPRNLTWQRVNLPFIGFKPKDNFRMEDREARLWVRVIDEPQGAGALEPRALTYGAYLAIGYRATAYVDGRRVAATDFTLSNDWNQPVLFKLPLQESAIGARREIVVAFNCDLELVGCAAPSLHLGSLSRATEYYERQRLLRIEAPRMGSFAMLFAGVFSLLFWIRRRREAAYLLFFIVAIIWTLRTLHYHLSHYPKPQAWFWWMTVHSLSWFSVAVYLFAFHLQGVRRPIVERTLLGLSIGSSVILLPPLITGGWLSEWYAYVVGALVSLATIIMLTLLAFKTRSRESTVLAIVLWPMLGMGIHDLLLMNWTLSFERFFLLPFAAGPLLAAFLYALASRYRGAIENVEALNQTLESRLAARQQELATSYDRLREIEVHNAQIQERQRLMRDMHDGIGSTLVSTLALVERGNSTPDLIAKTLRDAVDELKLAIDSLEENDHDLVTLLATLRYRLTPRLERAGLTVDWRVEDVPPLPWLDARNALQILRIVQECISNVLKHAEATRIEVAVYCANNAVSVRIGDNGRGFDVEQISRQGAGRGLKNIKARAQQVGAAVEFESSNTGTAVVLSLPVERGSP